MHTPQCSALSQTHNHNTTATATVIRSLIIVVDCLVNISPLQELKFERQARAELQQQLWQLSKGADAAGCPTPRHAAAAVASQSAAVLQHTAGHTSGAAVEYTYSQPVSPTTLLAGNEGLAVSECAAAELLHSQHDPQQHSLHQQPNMPPTHQQQQVQLLQQPQQMLQDPTYSTLSPSPPRTVCTPSIHNYRIPAGFVAAATRGAHRCSHTTSSFCSSSWSDTSSCCHQSSCCAGASAVAIPCSEPCGMPSISTAADLQQQHVRMHNSYAGLPPRIRVPAAAAATATPTGPQTAPPSQPRTLFPDHLHTAQVPGHFPAASYAAAAAPSGLMEMNAAAAASVHTPDPAAAVGTPAAPQPAAIRFQPPALPAAYLLGNVQLPAAVNTCSTAAGMTQHRAAAQPAAYAEAKLECKPSAFSILSQSCSSEASLQLLLDAAAARQHNGLQLLAESTLLSDSSSCDLELDTSAAAGCGWMAPGSSTGNATSTAVEADTARGAGVKVYAGFSDLAAKYGDNTASAYAGDAAVPGVSSAGCSNDTYHTGPNSGHSWSGPGQEHAVRPGTKTQSNRAAATHGAQSLADLTGDGSITATTGGPWLGAAPEADPAALAEAMLEAEFLSELSIAQLTVLKEERDLLAEQHKSLLQLLADSSVTPPGR